jgi:hypothetical protein
MSPLRAGYAAPQSASLTLHGTQIVQLNAATPTRLTAGLLQLSRGRYAALFDPAHQAGFVLVNLKGVGPSPISLPLSPTQFPLVSEGTPLSLDFSTDGTAVLQVPRGVQVTTRPAQVHVGFEVRRFNSALSGESATVAAPDELASFQRSVVAVSLLYARTPLIASRHGDACPTSTAVPECATSGSESAFLSYDTWPEAHGFGPTTIVYGRTYSSRQTYPYLTGYAAAPSLPGYACAMLLGFGLDP